MRRRWVVSAIERGGHWQVVVKDARAKPRPPVKEQVHPNPTGARAALRAADALLAKWDGDDGDAAYFGPSVYELARHLGETR